ncbi:MAG TPA: acetoacetate--CoA ligase [Streptosporangiaceae bacterium]|nr:acetoacetate--CoA ligase [Streptosporangiaceae bacterium]
MRQGQSSAFGRGYGATLQAPSADTVQRARITAYERWLGASRGVHTDGGYAGLWQWSVANPAEFWASIWDYFDVLGSRGSGPVLTGEQMPDVGWFSGSMLNYARNALRAADTDPDSTAVIYRSEAGHDGSLSYRELSAQVAVLQAALADLGVTQGDRVAAYLPNSPQALIGLLATASLGAIWTSCSPDFGAPSVVDRFAQVTPKVLITVDGYAYNGKRYDRRPEVAAIAAALPGLSALITVDYAGTGWGSDGPALPVPAHAWETLGAWASKPSRPEFTDVPFNHPLWVLYSSGTTGLPKPIVHGHGGIVLEHLKALCLHQDIGPGDVFFWYTTTGWMMWNYLAGALLAGATAVAYDGSATHPGTDELWRLAAETGVTYFGTGAPYLIACMKAGLRPAAAHDLSCLRGVGSTGSPLPPEAFEWVYAAVAPRQSAAGAAGTAPTAHRVSFSLGSFSGGTDLCTGFVGPNPLLPVRSGIIAGPCLGAKVEAYNEAGQSVIGEVGELVLTVPMPSMPVGFWGDESGDRYRASYFADFPGAWRHGDWIMFLPDGGCVIYGRSDATLNRGGVRMGTAEFYRVVEELPEVTDSLVIDTGTLGTAGRLVLYLVLAPGISLDDGLTARIRAALRSALSPRHVPDEIHQVPGVPRTLSGKKLEIPVRKILTGTPVSEAADPASLANPEVLACYEPGAAPEVPGETRGGAARADRGS